MDECTSTHPAIAVVVCAVWPVLWVWESDSFFWPHFLSFFSVRVKSFNTKEHRLAFGARAMPRWYHRNSEQRPTHGNPHKLTTSSARKWDLVARSERAYSQFSFYLLFVPFPLKHFSFSRFFFLRSSTLSFFTICRRRIMRCQLRIAVQKAYVNGNSSSHFEFYFCVGSGGGRGVVERQWIRDVSDIATDTKHWNEWRRYELRQKYENQKNKHAYRGLAQLDGLRLHGREYRRCTGCLLKNRTTVKLNF